VTLHAGRIYSSGDVSLGPTDAEAVRRSHGAWEEWLSRAEQRDYCYYFSIYCSRELVGEIFLHDIEWQAGEALVGYHLFEPRFRGIGIGTTALALLQSFVMEATELSRVVSITSADNHASKRIAEKRGFLYAGAPREDPTGVVMQWAVVGCGSTV
jgi:RimJ/RimL family protein N-acetyltransferase